ncbi:unnamed protein product, partial [Iphiclides podalirius]
MHARTNPDSKTCVFCVISARKAPASFQATRDANEAGARDGAGERTAKVRCQVPSAALASPPPPRSARAAAACDAAITTAFQRPDNALGTF